MAIHFSGHIELDMVTRNAGMFYIPLDLWDSKTQSYRLGSYTHGTLCDDQRRSSKKRNFKDKISIAGGGRKTREYYELYEDWPLS